MSVSTAHNVNYDVSINVPGSLSNGILPAPRLAFLDGLRGLAALYVTFYHALLSFRLLHPRGETLPHPLKIALLLIEMCFLHFGTWAVAVFVVLSGYCLMLPLARSGGTMPGGWPRFFVRRASRILPAYYAALALCLLAVLAVPDLRRPTGSLWDMALPALTPGPLLSHLFLVHNWTPWAGCIDPPAWTIATEWQIYGLFPLLALLWFRRGGHTVLLLTLAFGWLPFARFGLSPDGARPWYVFLFALGMTGAWIGFCGRARALQLRREVNWNRGALFFALTLALLYTGDRVSMLRPAMLSWPALALLAQRTWGDVRVLDVLCGLTTLCVLCACRNAKLPSAAVNSVAPPALMRFLEWRPCLLLGSFSYSLYLLHLPLMALAETLERMLRLSDLSICLLFLPVVLPFVLVISWGFSRGFERPFVSARSHIAPKSGHPASAL